MGLYITRRRILFVTSVQGWGGSELLWSQTARKLAARGHRVGAFVTRPPRPIVASLAASGVRVARLFPAWVPEGLRSRLADHLRAMVWLWQVARLAFGLLASPRSDLIVVSQGGNFDGLLLAAACRKLGRRYVLVSHKASELSWPGGSVLARLRPVFEDAAWCFFVSEHNRALTEEQLGVRLSRASVVRNPFQVRWRSDGDWPVDDGLRLACVGRLSVRDKGQDLLIRALARPKWRRRRVSVTFFGAGPDAGSLRRLARLLEVDAVSFAGVAQDIEAVWRNHHALVLPSRAEGLPIVAVEAMLCARPVICTDIGGNAELVEDGVTGFVAPFPTEDALDEALERAWGERNRWRSLGQAAAIRARALVPRDPAGLFADQLLEIAAGRAPAPGESAANPAAATSAPQPREPLSRAIVRGVDFLTQQQLPDGSFEVLINTDPQMRTGGVVDPSIFPTALAAHSLGFAPEAAPLRERALSYLLSEMEPSGLWKHWPREHPQHRELPPDVDDTCYAATALAAAGVAFPDNRDLLLANRASNGLFYTWFTPRIERPSSARHFRIACAQLRHPLILRAFFTQTSARPRDIDAVVNANALHYLGLGPETQAAADHILAVLREGREADADKWYENPFFIWYAFARVIGADPEAASLIEQRIDAAAPQTALDRALAICALLYCGRLPKKAAVEGLLALQKDDGRWPRASVYFGGRLRREDGSLAPAHPDTPRWGSDELTTAFCVEALSRWRATKRS